MPDRIPLPHAGGTRDNAEVAAFRREYPQVSIVPVAGGWECLFPLGESGMAKVTREYLDEVLRIVRTVLGQ